MADTVEAKTTQSSDGKVKTGRRTRAQRSIRKSAKTSAAERLRQAEMLLDLSKRVAAIESLDEILEILVEMTTWEVGAERGTLFLNDPQTGELYSRVAQGNFKREIRILNNSGIAGHVFSTGEGVIIHDAYADERFNRSVDEQTGFTTRSIICVPIKTVKGEIIGVSQALNKKDGKFSEDDLALLRSDDHPSRRRPAEPAVRRADEEVARTGNGVPGYCRRRDLGTGTGNPAAARHG